MSLSRFIRFPFTEWNIPDNNVIEHYFDFSYLRRWSYAQAPAVFMKMISL